jgi:hypothetical protein
MDTTTELVGKPASEITASARSPNDRVLGARNAANDSTTEISPDR